MLLLSKVKKNVTDPNALNKLENITKKTNWTLISPSVAAMPFSCDIFSSTTLPIQHICGYTYLFKENYKNIYDNLITNGESVLITS